MYCPDWKSEYRPGFTRCKDCDIDLVVELPAAAKQEFVDLVEVLSTADAAQIPPIKSILEAEEIPYLAQGENFALGRYIAVKFLVACDYLDDAKDALIDFL